MYSKVIASTLVLKSILIKADLFYQIIASTFRLNHKLIKAVRPLMNNLFFVAERFCDFEAYVAYVHIKCK